MVDDRGYRESASDVERPGIRGGDQFKRKILVAEQPMLARAKQMTPEQIALDSSAAAEMLFNKRAGVN